MWCCHHENDDVTHQHDEPWTSAIKRVALSSLVRREHDSGKASYPRTPKAIHKAEESDAVVASVGSSLVISPADGAVHSRAGTHSSVDAHDSSNVPKPARGCSKSDPCATFRILRRDSSNTSNHSPEQKDLDQLSRRSDISVVEVKSMKSMKSRWTKEDEEERHKKLHSILVRVLEDDEIATLRHFLPPGEALEGAFDRFLSANKFKVKPAVAMLRADLKWRLAVQPLELLRMAPEEICGCEPTLLKENMPTWHQGFCKESRPIMITHYGKFRFKPFVKLGITVDTLMKLHVHNSEKCAVLCAQQAKKLGRDMPGAFIILDASGFDAGNLRCSAAYDWANRIADVDQNHYPGRMGVMYIINAPSVVYYFYNVLKYAAPAEIRNKIHILSGKETWIPQLLERIDSSELPAEYGGCGVHRYDRPILMPELAPVSKQSVEDCDTASSIVGV